MRLDFFIRVCRGSIFTSTVKYNPDNWERLSSIFSGYMPLTQTSPSIDVQGNTIQLGGPMWSLTSKQEGIDINFLEGKIDIIVKNIALPYNPENICSLCGKIKDIFLKIINALGLQSNRLAFAPLIISNNNDAKSYISFARQIFSNRQFKGEQIDNCDFSNVFRIKETIDDYEVIINCLANFSLTQLPAVINGRFTMNNELQINVDINTLAGQSYNFSANNVASFYSFVPKLTIDFINSYFTEE